MRYTKSTYRSSAAGCLYSTASTPAHTRRDALRYASRIRVTRSMVMLVVLCRLLRRAAHNLCPWS